MAKLEVIVATLGVVGFLILLIALAFRLGVK